MHAIILAGGLGTRLRTLVADVPKSMADVGGRPFLEYLLLQLRRQGIRDIVLCTGYLSDSVQQYFADGGNLGLRISHSVETTVMGTAGALKLAEPLLSGDRFLLMNGDSFFDISVDQLIAEHRTAGALVTLALARVADAQRYGSVTLGAGSEVVGFAEKGGAAGPGLINGGVYLIERRVLELIAQARQVSLERDILPQLVSKGLHGMDAGETFIDIGVPEDYLRLRDDPELLRRLLP